MPGVASLKGTCLSLWKPLAYQRGVKGLGQPVSWDVPGLTPPGGVHVCVCACARPGQPGWAPEEGWWELSIHHWLPLRLINSAVSGTQQAYGLLSLLLFYSLELKSHFLSPRGKPIFHMKPQLISVCVRMCVCVCVCVGPGVQLPRLHPVSTSLPAAKSSFRRLSFHSSRRPAAPGMVVESVMKPGLC